MIRGDAAVVRERRDAGRAHCRAREAVQAEPAKLRPVSPAVAIAAEQLRREREAVAAKGRVALCRRRQTRWRPTSTHGHAGSSSSKIKLQGLVLERYPSKETVVEFAVSASGFER